MNEPDPQTIDPATTWARTLGDVQHDLRTHAGAATMWLELIAMARDDEERAHAVRMMRATLGDFVRLAEDLQDAATQAVGAGPDGASQAFDLAVCLRRAGQRIAPKAELRRIALELDTGGVDAYVIIGDAPAWERTFNRLLEATLQACDRRATFCVTLRRAGAVTELLLPAGGVELPPDDALPGVWAASRRRPGVTFARGLWLARRHLVDEGGGLALRDAGDGNGGPTLVATLPPATRG